MECPARILAMMDGSDEGKLHQRYENRAQSEFYRGLRLLTKNRTGSTPLVMVTPVMPPRSDNAFTSEPIDPRANFQRGYEPVHAEPVSPPTFGAGRTQFHGESDSQMMAFSNAPAPHNGPPNGR